MRNGSMLKSGDVVLAQMQFTDTFEVKKRPAVVLFEELGNVVIAGITSNINMQGIPLTKKEGAVRESVIKLNYIFTVSKPMITSVLFHLNHDKKEILLRALHERLDGLNARG